MHIMRYYDEEMLELRYSSCRINAVKQLLFKKYIPLRQSRDFQLQDKEFIY